jgi:glucose/arabinose dehydrogenase
MKSFYLFLAVCFSAAPCLAAPAVQDPSLKVEQVVFGLSLPTTMAFIGPDDILVLQLSDGRVRRVIGGVLQPGEVLDVAVDNDGERGLLGIALHPDFATNHFVYLYYTESSTGSDGGSPLGNRVYRYTWDGSALISPTLIVDLPVLPGANHNGGVIAFGPDEKLYVIIGDLNRNGQLQNFTDIGAPAPDDTSVILRLNDNGTSPTDNPFSSDPNNILSRYYAYGVRNSFGMAFDPVTGELWDTENGENTFDEINLVEPGFNSGWEFIMGPDSRNTNNASDLVSFAGSHYADPKFSWFNTVGPTAIVFLDSTQMGDQYENDVFAGDINNGNLYHFQPNASRDGFTFTSPALSDLVADDNNVELDEVLFGTGFNGITDLKVGPDGLLYVVSLFDGAIYRISQVVDVAPPDTIIDSGPSNPTNQTSAAFTFHSTESGSSFQCQLDNGGFSACTSGKSYSSLSDGGHSFQVRATDGAGNTDPTPASYDWTVDSTTQTPLSVGASFLPDAEVGVDYSADLGIGGGTAPYTVAPVRGSLPSGLVPNSAGIGGVPTVAKKFVFTLHVIDQAGASKTKQFTLNVLKSLDIGSTTLKSGRVGRSYKTTLIASRGKKPYAWSLISGDLPAGLTLGPGSGRITGTPSGAESQTFTVEVSDPLGGSKQKSFTLTIDP